MTQLTETELVKLGEKYFHNNEFDKARSILNEAIEQNGTNKEAFFLLANIFHTRGEVGKAIKAFKKVLEIDPCHTDASISLSVLYNDIGKYDEGRKIFEMANERVKNKKTNEKIEDVHINKKFSMRHFELAELYMTYNRFDEALFEYNKAIKLDPENLVARIKIAKVYAKKGFIGKAFEELRKLKTEYPEYLEARVALGVLHYANGNVLEAQTEWERVLTKDPLHKDASMYLNLSRTATETRLN
ncbi:MAG: tetratricopeptide repeat protein [Bacteriovoracaceae bacterium]